MATNATTAGLFTELFSSASAATQTIPDYRKFSTASVAITAITISINTTAIQGSAGNDVAPTSPAATATNPFSNFP